MDTNHIAELFRELRVTPSRRAVSTAVVALAASTALAPLCERVGAGGKKKKKKKKKNDPKDLIPPPCALGEIDCNGDPFACCAPQLCSPKCGGCPPNKPACCGDANSGNHFCYDPAEETCCPTTVAKIAGACPKKTFCATGAGGLDPVCCPSGGSPCAGGCCDHGLFCCAGEFQCCVDVSCDTSVAGCLQVSEGNLARTN
jgi:hypothetical protein